MDGWGNDAAAGVKIRILLIVMLLNWLVKISVDNIAYDSQHLRRNIFKMIKSISNMFFGKVRDACIQFVVIFHPRDTLSTLYLSM